MTTTLTEFLLARIAEDEAAPGSGDHWEPTYTDTRNRLELTHDGLMIAQGRVRDDCAAKREIIAEVLAAGADSMANGARIAVGATRRILQYLALPYADHPDYREEWRP